MKKKCGCDWSVKDFWRDLAGRFRVTGSLWASFVQCAGCGNKTDLQRAEEKGAKYWFNLYNELLDEHVALIKETQGSKSKRPITY